MKLRKVNRERQQVIKFTDAKGIEREAIVFRDNLHNTKKPPAWMQELMKEQFELGKGA